MASIFFLPKAMQMIAGSNPYRLGNILVLARRYSDHGSRPKLKTNDPQTHGTTTASYAGKPNDDSEVLPGLNSDQGKGNRELGAKTVKSVGPPTSG